MTTELSDIKFHAPPAKWKNPTAGCYYICGISPMEPFTPERFEAIEKEYERRQEEARESRKQLCEKTWEVPSSKDPDKCYTVSQHIDGSWTCECEGFKFRKKCSHIEKVKSNG